MTHEEARARLEEYRVLIDDVDRRIVALLNERTQVVENIGRVKRESELPIYEPKREDQVFANVTGSNQGPMSSDALRRIFERIIDEMRKIQRMRMEAAAAAAAAAGEIGETRALAPRAARGGTRAQLCSLSLSLSLSLSPPPTTHTEPRP